MTELEFFSLSFWPERLTKSENVHFVSLSTPSFLVMIYCSAFVYLLDMFLATLLAKGIQIGWLYKQLLNIYWVTKLLDHTVFKCILYSACIARTFVVCPGPPDTFCILHLLPGQYLFCPGPPDNLCIMHFLPGQ